MTSLSTFFQRLFQKVAPNLNLGQRNIERAVCLYLVSFFTNTQSVSEIVQELDVEEEGNARQPISRYVKLYSRLEAFVVQSNLPEVSSTFTVDELRDYLRKKFGGSLQQLEPSFYLIFATGVSQSLLLYSLGLRVLGQLFNKTVGFPLFQNTVLLHRDQRCLKHLKLGENEVVLTLPKPEELECSLDEVRASYGELYHQLYVGLETGFGKEAARDVFATLSSTVKENYPPDLSTLFSSILEVPSA